ncbi:MAG: hypothetical protein RMM53_02625 [Bacteroidia bacterium]|nr:hypothetical protein [Bacteroidia bacterium]MDW8333091.1 hypothetical protein [Bacteroidia bacterium]
MLWAAWIWLAAHASGQTGEGDFFRPKGTFSIGGVLATNGWGLDALASGKIGPKTDWTAAFSLMSQKDPRETRIESLFGEQGRRYVFDKQNVVFVFYAGAGIERIIQPLDAFSRLTIRAGATAGPLITLLKPYYLEIFHQVTGNEGVRRLSVYNPAIHNYGNIIGEAEFFNGFDKIRLMAGFRLRAHATFNFTTSNLFVRALIIGGQADIYPKPLPIMTTHPNRAFIPAAFIGIHIGSGWTSRMI